MKCNLLGAALFGALVSAPAIQAQAVDFNFTSLTCGEIMESEQDFTGAVVLFDGFLSGIYQNVDDSYMEQFTQILAEKCRENPSQTVWQVIEDNGISK